MFGQGKWRKEGQGTSAKQTRDGKKIGTGVLYITADGGLKRGENMGGKSRGLGLFKPYQAKEAPVERGNWRKNDGKMGEGSHRGNETMIKRQ